MCQAADLYERTQGFRLDALGDIGHDFLGRTPQAKETAKTDVATAIAKAFQAFIGKTRTCFVSEHHCS